MTYRAVIVVPWLLTLAVPSVVLLFCVVGVTGCSKKEAPAPVIVTNDKPAPQKLDAEPSKVEETGTVKLEFDVAVDAKAVVTISGVEYTPKELEQAITLKPGRHTVVVKQPGLDLAPKEFTVEKGQRRIVRLYDPERNAAAWVLSVGGVIQADVKDQRQGFKDAKDLPAGPLKVIGVDLSFKKFDDAGLRHLKELKHVTGVGMHYTQVEDAWLANLSDLKTLTALGLSATPVGDMGLSHLSGLTNLTDLDLYVTRVTDAGLVHLKNLTKLKRLLLNGNKGLADAGVAHLKALDPHSLFLGGTQIGDVGLAHLSGMKSLTTLDLNGTKVTDPGLESLRNLTGLGELNVDATKVSDAGLVHLKGLTKLVSLGIAATQVTDAGLVHLKGLKELGNLRLAGTKVTDAGVADLKTALPKCNVSK